MGGCLILIFGARGNARAGPLGRVSGTGMGWTQGNVKRRAFLGVKPVKSAVGNWPEIGGEDAGAGTIPGHFLQDSATFFYYSGSAQYFSTKVRLNCSGQYSYNYVIKRARTIVREFPGVRFMRQPVLSGTGAGPSRKSIFRSHLNA